jgi:hypothetical protein
LEVLINKFGRYFWRVVDDVGCGSSEDDDTADGLRNMGRIGTLAVDDDGDLVEDVWKELETCETTEGGEGDGCCSDDACVGIEWETMCL